MYIGVCPVDINTGCKTTEGVTVWGIQTSSNCFSYIPFCISHINYQTHLQFSLKLLIDYYFCCQNGSKTSIQKHLSKTVFRSKCASLHSGSSCSKFILRLMNFTRTSTAVFSHVANISPPTGKVLFWNKRRMAESLTV